MVGKIRVNQNVRASAAAAKHLARNTKDPGHNQGLSAERTGTEQSTNSLRKTGVPK